MLRASAPLVGALDRTISFMAISRGNSMAHWAYFIALEEDFGNLSRYVEFAEPNYGTYSIEFARLLLTAGAEVDVLLKTICTQLTPEAEPDRISGYHPIIATHLPGFFEFEVSLPHWEMTIVPWEQWKDGVSPRWWKAHTRVKHKRHEHFADANLFKSLYRHRSDGVTLRGKPVCEQTGCRERVPAPDFEIPSTRPTK